MNENVERFAELLDGRKYRHEMTRLEEIEAKQQGIVILFGYSDDNAEFMGAIDEEVGCYGGGEIYLKPGGVCVDPFNPTEEEKAAGARSIKLIWDDGSGYSWRYETGIPHAAFTILEDGEPFCEGIVFCLDDAPLKPVVVYDDGSNEGIAVYCPYCDSDKIEQGYDDGDEDGGEWVSYPDGKWVCQSCDGEASTPVPAA